MRCVCYGWNEAEHSFYATVSCASASFVLIGSLMMLSVNIQRGGFDDDDYIIEVVPVKIIME